MVIRLVFATVTLIGVAFAQFDSPANIVPRDGIKHPAPSQAEMAKGFIFSLGVTREQVVMALGPPESYLADDHYWRTYPGLLDFVPWEIYERKTDRNTYEVQVLYTADTSESRLHPTLRVREVKFVLDKHMGVNSAIADLPEFAQLCRAGCAVRGTIDPGFEKKRTVLLFPYIASAGNAAGIVHTDDRVGDWSQIDVSSVTLGEMSQNVAFAYRQVFNLGSWTSK